MSSALLANLPNRAITKLSYHLFPQCRLAVKEREWLMDELMKFLLFLFFVFVLFLKRQATILSIKAKF